MIHTRKGRVALGLTVAVTLLATLALTFGASADAPAPAPVVTSSMHMHMRASGDQSKKAAAFHDHMRKLWEDHITWTRLFIVSFTANLPDLNATTNRLLQNQVDIGNAVRPFYGDNAADELTKLLTKHITTAADLLTAAKASDTSAFNSAKDAWYRNARHIARFLHEANPQSWPLQDLRSMMREHLDLTLQEASDHLTGHYVKDVADYDAVHHEILQMADMLSSGIIAQFPGRF
jgi:hypothetical protein